ncbi:hypothetical protein H5410_008792 [Solanum commersonii]|uniref:Uncharacterized protein n=1 Tax=Solanum commersonii TaxID=4109 RepID=A0A9J6AFY5_SOLCO|nr:hypothetical protein H5410_008792 [Solanum commersonii]
MPSLSSTTMYIRYLDERNNDFTTSVLSTSPVTREIRYSDEIINETMEFRYDNERFDTGVQFPRPFNGWGWICLIR